MDMSLFSLLSQIRVSSWIRLTVCVVLLLGIAPSASASDDDDPFALSNRALPHAYSPAQLVVFADHPATKLFWCADYFWTKPSPTSELITFKIAVEPKEAVPGTIVKMTITGTLKPGYHTYPLTQRSSDPAQAKGYLSQIDYHDAPGLKPLWPVAESDPEFAKEFVGVLLEHKKPFIWSQDILILLDTPPGTKTLRFGIHLTVCNEDGCSPSGAELEAKIDVAKGPAVALSSELEKRLKAERPAILVKPVPPNFGVEADSGDGSLLGLLAASVSAAILMLLTPCVFPMIPITVSFFLKQSEKEHHKPLATAGVYALTIIVVLAAAVLILGKLIVTWANSPWLNLGLGLVLVFFALSLLGMYEIELPSRLARFTSAHEGRGGYVGTFFMALTFTITSFTCTGPFLGPLLVATKEMQLGLGRLLIAALAYSATFAAPFFVMALFPSLLKALPRSGGWMNLIKVVMGFLELAAAFKFLANTDLAFHPGNPWLFNYETVLCSWIGLALACGLYLFGLFRLPHDSPVEHVGVARMLVGALFFSLALYMAPALWRQVPQGFVGRGIVGFLPLDTKAGNLSWSRDYEEAWERAVAEKKPIFIDFTGVNCSNCRANEAVFSQPAVHRELEKYILVQLYNDTVPDTRFSRAADAEREAQRNLTWQENTFHDVSTPLYVILEPDKDSAFEDGKLKGTVLGQRKGYIKDIRDFEDFLKRRQEKQVAKVNEAGD